MVRRNTRTAPETPTDNPTTQHNPEPNINPTSDRLRKSPVYLKALSWAVAIAKGLIQAFGGIAVINGESQLVGSWGEVEELIEGNDLAFDSIRIEFQHAREEPLLLLNVVVGSATLPPLWQIHFERTTGAPVDCVVEVRTRQCSARLAAKYSQPFDCNKLLVGTCV